MSFIAKATLLAAFTATAAPAAAMPAYDILCRHTDNGGVQRIEGYEPAPGTVEIWYGLNAHIKIFEPLIRGTPIGPDNVMRARIRPLGMDVQFHTAAHTGYASMTHENFTRIFATGLPGHPGTPINGWLCAADTLHMKPRFLPLDPRRIP